MDYFVAVDRLYIYAFRSKYLFFLQQKDQKPNTDAVIFSLHFFLKQKRTYILQYNNKTCMENLSLRAWFYQKGFKVSENRRILVFC